MPGNPSARQALLDLAERCEREEPSWRLTCEVEAAITPGAHVEDGTPQGGSIFLRVWGKREWRPAPYTTSLDAAVTLIPSSADSWCFDYDDASKASEARISVGTGRHLFMARAATPALALCAASLRARAQEVGDE